MYLHLPPTILCAAVVPLLAVASQAHETAGWSDSRDGVTARAAQSTRLAPFSPFHRAGGRATQLAQTDDPATREQKRREYLDSVTEEAAKTSADVRASSEPEAPEPAEAESQQTASPGTPKAGSWRMDEIRSIVGAAAAASNSKQAEAKKPATKQPTDRRQEIRELVRGAPSASDVPDDTYVSKIRQEGAATVVVDETMAVIAPPEAGEPPGGERFYVYTVKPGDSLWLIAKRVYGDGYKWDQIFRVNASRVADENELTIGQELRIPRL